MAEQFALDGMKSILVAAAGAIPGVGTVAAVAVGLALGLLFPNQTTDVWAEIRDKVQALVKKEIADAHFAYMRLKLQGILHEIEQYTMFVKNNDDNTQILNSWNAAQSAIVGAVPAFQDPRFAVLLLPLFGQLANLHILLLRDAIKSGKSWGMTDSTIKTWKDILHKAVGPGTDPKTNYTAWVTKQYKDHLATLNMDSDPYSYLEFECLMTVNAYEYAQDIWPYYDPVQYPGAVIIDRKREVYIGPFGLNQNLGGRYNDFHPKLVTRDPITVLDVWSWDRVDAFQVTYGSKVGGRQGTRGGSNNSQAHAGAGGKWILQATDSAKFNDETYINRIWVESSTKTPSNLKEYGVYRFAFRRNNGYESHWCGTNPARSPVTHSVSAFGFDGYVVSLIYVYGSNPAGNAADGMIVGFRPRRVSASVPDIPDGWSLVARDVISSLHSQ